MNVSSKNTMESKINDDEEVEEVSDYELLDKIENDDDDDNKKKDNIKLNIKKRTYDDEDEEEVVVGEDAEEDDDDDDDDDDDENAYVTDDDDDEKKTTAKSNVVDDATSMVQNNDIDIESDNEDDEEDEEEDENYLKKFDKDVKNNFLESYHPEAYSHNFEEVKMLTNVVRDENNNIIDELHKTIPIMTKFEKSRILGQRAKQIDSGARPFVKFDKTIIDGYLIALKELEEKKIPFIIKRPLPNGGFEYWNVSDLELVC
jgi:DNA-directed RNA polymerase I, II, and III subunit RPABC2